MSKISIVTGGSSGLGFEITKCLLEMGKSVCIVSSVDSNLNSASFKLSSLSLPARLHTYPANIGNESEVSGLFEYIAREGFEVEMLFNAAGRGLFGSPESVTREIIDAVFEANLVGTILVTTHALRIMKDKGGVILNILSTAAHMGRSQESVYCAAKWGARGYTEALRAATKGTTIKVIAVYPGGMNTPFWSKACGMSPDVSGFMDPQDVAKRIVEIATSDNAAHVTEITINRRA